MEFAKRSESILQICLQYEPDIICFQECTRGFINNHLINCFEIWDTYDCSDIGDGSSVGSYGVLMLTKKYLNVTFIIQDMNSRMDRKFLMCKFNMKGEDMIVGTVHLESLNNHDIREKQLEICHNSCKNVKHSIICGDFNFCSYRNFNPKKEILENRCLRNICNDYIDIWDDLIIKPYMYQLKASIPDTNNCNRSNPTPNTSTNTNSIYNMHNKLTDDDINTMPLSIRGYTFDSEVNNNIANCERFRLDRFLYKTQGAGSNSTGANNTNTDPNGHGNKRNISNISDISDITNNSINTTHNTTNAFLYPIRIEIIGNQNINANINANAAASGSGSASVSNYIIIDLNDIE